MEADMEVDMSVEEVDKEVDKMDAEVGKEDLEGDMHTASRLSSFWPIPRRPDGWLR